MAEVSENKRSILRGSFGSAAAILLARILGLFRVMLEADVLGGKALATIWQTAFMVPNLFRRLLGEGALSQALIPMISHTEAEKGLTEVRRQLAVVFAVLTVLLVIITLVVSGAGLIIGNCCPVPDYVKNAMHILPLIMPYAIFICLVGVMTAVVNTRKVFFLASLNALVLNIVLITLLYLAGEFAHNNSAATLYILVGGVLISGVLQLAMLVYLLKRYNVLPLWQKSGKPAKTLISELYKLALPGLIGGGATQIGFLIDRAIALKLGDYAVPALNYTERLVYLPVGLVAVALGSVLMANMSRAAANKNYDEMLDDMTLGLRYVWFLCAPMAIFMIAYREPLIRLLFMRGKFTGADVLNTADALLYYAMGIPAFCSLKILLPGFYARKKMTTPLKISLICIVLNIPLSIILMHPLKQGGIALATVIAQMVNNMLLLHFLRKDGFYPAIDKVAVAMLRSTCFALLAAFPALYYTQITHWMRIFTIKALPDAVPLILAMVFFGVIYLGCSYLAKAPEPGEFIGSIISRKSRKKEC